MHRGNATGAHPVEKTTDLRQMEFKLASRAQREEIVRHRDRLVRRLGHMVSLDDAARDWIQSCAHEWRARFEADWRG